MDFFELLHDIVPEDAIERMKNEKIGPDEITSMSDQELTQYVPLHGDRIRVRSVLKKNNIETKSTERQKHLISILKDKIEIRRGNKRKPIDDDMRNTKRPYGNKNAMKVSRRIEIGWIHKTKAGSLQVRQKKGGGTRRINIPKTSTKEDLLAIGKELFFPNGESMKGSLANMECDVWDFRDRPVLEEVTVGDIYNETKMPLLRFYFATTEKTEMEHEQDTLPQLARPKQRKAKDILTQAIEIAGISGASDEESSSVTRIFDETDEEYLSNAETGNQDEHQDQEEFPQSDSATRTFPQNIEPGSPRNKHIKLHRGLLMKEIIAAFKEVDPVNDIVSIEMIMPNGTTEAAEDGGGVTRDAITEFWNAFYEECTLGNQFKVPCLRHDFAQNEWVAVAKIIVYGWKSVGYFPVQLSSVFLEQCIFGGIKGDLKIAFLNYISDTDSNTLKNALSDINSVEKDELLEVLEQHEVKHLPTQDNIERIVNEISHKELIQSVMFIIDCWNPILQCLRLSEERLRSFYDDLCPTNRRVLHILKFPDTMTSEESQVANHLRRFVRELDATFLKRFLRFCTGSDLLIGKTVEVAFVNVVGLARRPVAHTCSCMLELPKLYENFPLFRKEFMAILNAAVWVMDII